MYSKICNFCSTIIYRGNVNGVCKWFEDESCTHLHISHKSSEIKKRMLQIEKILNSTLRKLQYLSEDVEELKNNFKDCK